MVRISSTTAFRGGIKTRLVDLPVVSDVGSICSISVTIDGRTIEALGYGRSGAIRPTALDGRAPMTDDEVTLGSQTLRELKLQMGDHVTKSPAGDVRLRIVGRVVVPSVIDPQAVADGAILTGAGLGRLENPDNLSVSLAPVVRFRSGVDPDRARGRSSGSPKVGGDTNSGVLPVTAPLEVERIEQLDRLPSCSRSSGRSSGASRSAFARHQRAAPASRLAVLKSLGFDRRQLAATVCVQATTIVVIGLLVGVVGGVVSGSSCGVPRSVGSGSCPRSTSRCSCSRALRSGRS